MWHDISLSQMTKLKALRTYFDRNGGRQSLSFTAGEMRHLQLLGGNESISVCRKLIQPSRGWGGWTASLTQWTGVWARSGRWGRTGKPGVQSMGLQRVGHDWATEQQHPMVRNLVFRLKQQKGSVQKGRYACLWQHGWSRDKYWKRPVSPSMMSGIIRIKSTWWQLTPSEWKLCFLMRLLSSKDKELKR